MNELFDIEEKIIIDAEDFVACEDIDSKRLKEEYSLLLKNYKKLYKQLNRLIRINDKQSSKLNAENIVLEKFSKYDELTGILNRRAFNQLYNEEWSKGIKSNTCLSLLIIDIDHFKVVNDTFGHQTGDKILIQVALEIQATARRKFDVASRYGGEEFVLMLPGVTKKDAYSIADRLRKKIEFSDYKHKNEPVKITISIGVTTIVPEQSIEPELVVEQADQALYLAKRTGRNKVNTYDDVRNEGE